MSRENETSLGIFLKATERGENAKAEREYSRVFLTHTRAKEQERKSQRLLRQQSAKLFDINELPPHFFSFTSLQFYIFQGDESSSKPIECLLMTFFNPFDYF